MPECCPTIVRIKDIGLQMMDTHDRAQNTAISSMNPRNKNSRGGKVLKVRLGLLVYTPQGTLGNKLTYDLGLHKMY